MSKHLIISAFPGTGKSYLYNTNPEKYGDSDSSQFSWTSPGVRNPNFVKDYVDHIEEASKTKRVLFVSSHEEVREEMRKRGIPYFLVRPDRSLKEEYIERFKQRGSPEAFVTLMENKWDEMIDSCEKDSGNAIVFKEPDRYISDIINVFLGRGDG